MIGCSEKQQLVFSLCEEIDRCFSAPFWIPPSPTTCSSSSSPVLWIGALVRHWTAPRFFLSDAFEPIFLRHANPCTRLGSRFCSLSSRWRFCIQKHCSWAVCCSHLSPSPFPTSTPLTLHRIVHRSPFSSTFVSFVSSSSSSSCSSTLTRFSLCITPTHQSLQLTNTPSNSQIAITHTFTRTHQLAKELNQG